MKNQLLKLLKDYPKSWLMKLKSKKNKQMFDMLMSIDEYKSLSLQEKIYWYLNDLHEYPKCKVCGERISLKSRCSPITGYATQYCSMSCSIKSEEHQDKTKKLMLEKYGVDSYAKSEQFKKQMRDIAVNRTDYQRKKINDTRKRTCLSKYGVDAISKVKCIKDKAVATYNSKSEDEKKRIQDKIRSTKTEKYGPQYMKEICKNNINVGQQLRAYALMKNNKKAIPTFSFEEFLQMKRDKKHEFEFKCLSCHKTYIANEIKNCPFCGYLSGRSDLEKDMSEFVLSLDKNAILNTRKTIYPLELDVYCKDINLAIEFDGLYWHSDDNKNKRYHLSKTEACESKGIQLVHVFENEWIEKQDIVKSRLKNLLGIHDKTVFARKCEVREVANMESILFQDENHIQGAVNSKVSLGLYHDGELISLMTFGKCRFDKKHEWELLRFCNKLGYHIPGGASRLLKHFERNWKPASLVSYADRRWSQGKLYKALGFKLDHASAPNYWYWKNNSFKLESRVKYQKHKLKNLLEKFDESKTEVENMKDNGYHRIFDCGNLVFEKTYLLSK